jgi:hypothetical protein
VTFREEQLRERDVRKTAPLLNPSSFLELYIASNFPQTAALPSEKQQLLGVMPQASGEDVNYKKKPLSGTSYDNPAGY